jgi:hypothetical protein
VLGAGVLTNGVADHAPSTVGVTVMDGVAGDTDGGASVICGDAASVGLCVSAVGAEAGAATGAGVITEPATMPAGAAFDGSRPRANAIVTTTAQKTIALVMIRTRRVSFRPRGPAFSPSPSGRPPALIPPLLLGTHQS